MKKLLTFLSFTALLSSGAFAQGTFPTTNATWTQRIGQGEALAKYSVIGLKNEDVVLGGQSYHKVFMSETDVTLGTSAYVGGLREDIGARRIYFYDLSTSAEKLIYDFSLSVGDTIHTGPGGAADGVVYSVDIVNIGGVDRTRITFRQLSSSSPWSSGEWVEGIGNTGLGGLLGSAMMQPTCDCGIKTLCFSNNGVTQYHNADYSSIDCDNVFSLTGVEILTSPEVKVSPNPASGSANFYLTGSVKYTKLSIADVTGKVIVSKDVTGYDNVTVDTHNMDAGLYVYTLHSADGVATIGKFVISE